jgi:hypothetical protein
MYVTQANLSQSGRYKGRNRWPPHRWPAAWRARRPRRRRRRRGQRLSGRFHPHFCDQNRRDIGKSQSIWTDAKINLSQDGNARLTAVCGQHGGPIADRGVGRAHGRTQAAPSRYPRTARNPASASVATGAAHKHTDSTQDIYIWHTADLRSSPEPASSTLVRSTAACYPGVEGSNTASAERWPGVNYHDPNRATD